MDADIQKEIDTIKEQIIKKYKPDKIILFGSAARGDFNLDSDVDLLIIKQDTPFYGADRIRNSTDLSKGPSRLTCWFIGRKNSIKGWRWRIPS
jgi:predicted nucleotidyltransferase